MIIFPSITTSHKVQEAVDDFIKELRSTITTLNASLKSAANEKSALEFEVRTLQVS